jgi:hypothetical protein
MSSLNDPENFAGRVNFAAFIVHRATFHFSSDPARALAEAIDNCNRRASGEHWAGAKA